MVAINYAGVMPVVALIYDLQFQTIHAVHFPVSMTACVYQKGSMTMNVIVLVQDTTEETVKYVSTAVYIIYNVYSISSLSFLVAYWSTWFSNLIRPSTETVHYMLTHYKWLWTIINNVEFLRDSFLRAMFKRKMMQR